MKRVFLTENLPETSLIKRRPDIRQKLEAHSKEQQDYFNECPRIGFFPMSKYDVRKYKNYPPMSLEERNSQLKNSDRNSEDSKQASTFLTRMKAAIETLPQRSRAKASKLLPYLLPMEASLNTGEINIRDILYDLTSQSKNIKTPQHEVLSSILRQLEENSQVNKRLYYNKIYSEKRKSSQKSIDRGHPEKGRPKSWQGLAAGYFSKLKPQEEERSLISSSSPLPPKKKGKPSSIQRHAKSFAWN